MKKVLSLMMMLMFAIGAWAETVTFADEGYSNGEAVESYEGTDFSVTFDKGTNSNVPKYYTTGAAIRVYGGNCFTVSSSTKTISKIEFTFASGGGTNVLTSDVEAYEDGIWEGSSSAVTFTVSGTSGHLRLAAIAVTFDDGTEPPVTVATPVISGETPFTESTQVTITCATEGASIYYTLDGATPTNASNEYSGAFELTETTTVKAIAYDANNNASSVATKEFVKEEPVVLTNVATVAEFNALADGTDFIFTGNLVATGQTGKYLYAQDSDNGILIYGTIDQTYSDLAEIPGGWTGKKTTFNGAPEAAEPAGLAAATEHVDLAPEEMTPAQVTLENAFKYVVIRGATVTMTNNNNGTITVGDETVALYKRFNVTIPTDDGVYDIIGITGYYNAPQFMPLEFVAQGVDVATPVIEGETPFVGSTTVTITCTTEGASIYYTTDGTEPTNQSTAYNAPFELTESATVKAIAYDTNNNASVVASKEFVKKVACATVTEILALDNNTEFTFTGSMTTIAQAVSANGNSRYLYAQDEEGVGMLLFNAPVDYSKGDVIPAGWAGKITQYKGAPEVTTISGMQAATETAELTAAEMTPAEVTVNPYNLFHYAVIKGASLGENGAIVAGEESVAGYYDRFSVYFPEDYEGKTYDVYGIPSWYNNAQFIPLEIVEVQQVVENTITYEAEQEGGTIAVALADGTQVESGVTKVAAGAKVTITATPAEGYKLSELVVKCGDEVIEFDNETTTGRAAETHTFTMPEGEVSIEATFEEETPTGIENLSMENVKSVRFYNIAGVESATPFNGVNIVVREMTDGSKSVIKVVK